MKQQKRIYRKTNVSLFVVLRQNPHLRFNSSIKIFFKQLGKDSPDEGNNILPTNKEGNGKSDYLEKQEMWLYFIPD